MICLNIIWCNRLWKHQMVDQRSSLWRERSNQTNNITNGTDQSLDQAETVIYHQREIDKHNPLNYLDSLHQNTSHGAVTYQPWSLPAHQNTSNQDVNRDENWKNSSSNTIEKNVSNGSINGTLHGDDTIENFEQQRPNLSPYNANMSNTAVSVSSNPTQTHNTNRANEFYAHANTNQAPEMVWYNTTTKSNRKNATKKMAGVGIGSFQQSYLGEDNNKMKVKFTPTTASWNQSKQVPQVQKTKWRPLMTTASPNHFTQPTYKLSKENDSKKDVKQWETSDNNLDNNDNDTAVMENLQQSVPSNTLNSVNNPEHQQLEDQKQIFGNPQIISIDKRKKYHQFLKMTKIPGENKRRSILGSLNGNSQII